MDGFWQWFFSIIGGVAFIMAIQPFTQYIWGKPNLSVKLAIEKLDSNVMLFCRVGNIPIKNKLLRFLGVRTNTIEQLGIEFRIYQKNNIQLGKTFTALIKSQYGQMSEFISLPASLRQAETILVAYNQTIKHCHIEDFTKSQAELLDGIYEVKIVVIYENIKREIKQTIYAGSQKPYIAFVDKGISSEGTI